MNDQCLTNILSEIQWSQSFRSQCSYTVNVRYFVKWYTFNGTIMEAQIIGQRLWKNYRICNRALSKIRQNWIRNDLTGNCCVKPWRIIVVEQESRRTPIPAIRKKKQQVGGVKETSCQGSWVMRMLKMLLLGR